MCSSTTWTQYPKSNKNTSSTRPHCLRNIERNPGVLCSFTSCGIEGAKLRSSLGRRGTSISATLFNSMHPVSCLHDDGHSTQMLLSLSRTSMAVSSRRRPHIWYVDLLTGQHGELTFSSSQEGLDSHHLPGTYGGILAKFMANPRAHLLAAPGRLTPEQGSVQLENLAL